MRDYYNEIEPFAIEWLRNLMRAGLIPEGDIDTRSIEDVRPDELRGYRHCHFFAGLGGWALALQLAGWPDDEQVWTGSCPCQPFSTAGKGGGFADERHLWPSWHYLIDECRPAVVFGEQVASKDADPWIDLVHADMEGMGYAFGCVPFPAAGIGAPHIRDRNYWLGVGQADSDNARLEGWQLHAERAAQCAAGSRGVAGGLADTDHERRAGFDALLRTEKAGRIPSDLLEAAGRSAVNGYWRAADWLGCTDGKWRPVEPGTFPLAHGIPGRVGRLRAYGNAIVPQAAAEFIQSYRDARVLMEMFS